MDGSMFGNGGMLSDDERPKDRRRYIRGPTRGFGRLEDGVRHGYSDVDRHICLVPRDMSARLRLRGPSDPSGSACCWLVFRRMDWGLLWPRRLRVVYGERARGRSRVQ